ncbi:MAG: alpha/beta hydrolase [Burkholderiaceae bacterium]|nr:alpha/beta hydrolase [Burkholderiaceae bacterium]
MDSLEPYLPRRAARSEFASLRGLRIHLNVWGDETLVTPERPALVLLHGWMDVGASFQFVVDAMAPDRFVIAPDWRGFGLSDSPATDCYWFPDYLGDLDALLDARLPGQAIDLVGHSMGGNIAMLYAGVRPARVRRLVNLEGFGLPDAPATLAPGRYLKWLDELKEPQKLRSYPSVQAVAARLRRTNPLLRPERAAWLAPHWSRCERNADTGASEWVLLADPAHKLSNPVLYRKDETLACWQQISAPLLWVDGDQTDISKWWGRRYSADEFHERLTVVPHVEKHRLSPAGHMLHHDQPEALAARLTAFFDAPERAPKVEVATT